MNRGKSMLSPRINFAEPKVCCAVTCVHHTHLRNTHTHPSYVRNQGPRPLEANVSSSAGPFSLTQRQKKLMGPGVPRMTAAVFAPHLRKRLFSEPQPCRAQGRAGTCISPRALLLPRRCTPLAGPGLGDCPGHARFRCTMAPSPNSTPNSTRSTPHLLH